MRTFCVALLLSACGRNERASPEAPTGRQSADGDGGARLVATWSGHSAPVHCVSVSATRPRAVSASDDGTLRLWDTGTGKELSVWRGHNDKVWAAAFLPSGHQILSGGWDGLLKLWDVDSGKELASWAPVTTSRGIAALAVSGDGQIALSPASTP